MVGGVWFGGYCCVGICYCCVSVGDVVVFGGSGSFVWFVWVVWFCYLYVCGVYVVFGIFVVVYCFC